MAGARGFGNSDMPLNVRIERDVVILSNFARLMNDPRYTDANRDTRELLDQGFANFVLDLGGVHETGGSFLGLLVTLTRLIRSHGGEAVLAHLSPDTIAYLESMRLGDFWDVFENAAGAIRFFDDRRDNTNQ